MPIPKLLDLEEAAHVSELWQRFGAKVVLVCGCFDLLHPGHIRLLKYARMEGRILIVGINSDRSASKLKGEDRPILSAWVRAEILAGLDAVTHVVVFDDPHPGRVLAALRPDVYVKGADYRETTLPELLDQSHIPKIVYAPYHTDFSTTALLKHIDRNQNRISPHLPWPQPYTEDSTDAGV